jgi:SAM-dependent methyltransferase
MTGARLPSCLCTQARMTSDPFVSWLRAMQPASVGPDGTPHLHRKLWEWCYIAQALSERGMLHPGRRGLGFAVGQEPLAALFASRGCAIVATDMDPEGARAAGWAGPTQEHAAALDDLNKAGVCEPGDFRRLVSFRVADMNDIRPDLRGFDFCWSSCAMEHLGSIGHGLRFIDRMLDCLKPGGVAVHTTEFNLLSDGHTVDDAPTVLFRRRDVLEMQRRARAAGHRMEVDFDPGDQPADAHVDAPPYTHHPHLKLLLANHVTTSIGLVIEKAGASARGHRLVG